MAEPLGISGILPSTGYDQGTARDLYISEPEIEEYDHKTMREAEGSEVNNSREYPKSIQVHRTEVPTVEPTVIPTTFASFRLSAAKVSSKVSIVTSLVDLPDVNIVLCLHYWVPVAMKSFSEIIAV